MLRSISGLQAPNLCNDAGFMGRISVGGEISKKLQVLLYYLFCGVFGRKSAPIVNSYGSLCPYKYHKCQLHITCDFIFPQFPPETETHPDLWYRDPKIWPKKRTPEIFDDWFGMEFQSMIMDLDKTPSSKNNYVATLHTKGYPVQLRQVSAHYSIWVG